MRHILLLVCLLFSLSIVAAGQGLSDSNLPIVIINTDGGADIPGYISWVSWWWWSGVHWDKKQRQWSHWSDRVLFQGDRSGLPVPRRCLDRSRLWPLPGKRCFLFWGEIWFCSFWPVYQETVKQGSVTGSCRRFRKHYWQRHLLWWIAMARCRR